MNNKILNSTISLTAVILFFISVYLVPYEASGTDYKFIRIHNGFYMISTDSSGYRMYEVNPNGETIPVSSEKILISDVFYGYSSAYIYGNDGGYTPIIKCPSGSLSILEDLNIKNGCITTDNKEILYVVDISNQNTVLKINLKTRRILETMDMGVTVNALFVSRNSGIVFALTDNGLTETESRRLISCDIPQTPIDMNGTYCTDSIGNVYTFDDTNGFIRIMTTGYSHAQTMNGTVYVQNGNEILKLDENGNPLAKCSFASNIDDMCAGTKSIAVLCGGSTAVVDENSFEPLLLESTPDESVNQPSSPEVSHTDISAQPNETENSTATEKFDNISSDTYLIENGFIKNIPVGTTAAVFKKNISYGNNDILLINHNGQRVTSGKIGTGWTVTFSGGSQSQSFLTVVCGDLTGEGNVNSRDYDVISDYLVKKCTLDELHIGAADLNTDGMISCTDALLILKEMQNEQ